MTAAMVFTKKELIESWRTHRFLILTVVFLIFGILSPLMAKLLPELLKSGLGGVKVTVPTPTSLDSWTQYYKNLTQMGIYVFALMLGGCVSQEIQQGTLINLVTKGLPRWSVIVAKSVVGLLQWLWCICGDLGLYRLLFPRYTQPPCVISSTATGNLRVFLFESHCVRFDAGN